MSPQNVFQSQPYHLIRLDENATSPLADHCSFGKKKENPQGILGIL
jgi:hypothetical protein